MNRFFVLHLSDLHIRDSITVTLDNLIESIATNKDLQNNKLVMVITGDIIDRGNYDGYKNTVIEFFNKLQTRIKSSNINIVDIHIVPGNHDKKTDTSNKLFSIAQQKGIEYPANGAISHVPTEEEVFQLQANGFVNFLELCNEIFKIFDIKSGEHLKQYSETFGADISRIDSTEIVFLRINTAFSCYGSPGDSEKYHLTVGQYQLNKILSKYKKLKNNNNIITLCLAHHPISYMTPKEVNEINKLLISKDKLCVDYFLSGHIHDSAITNLSDHSRNMISLETGIGWPDSLDSKHTDHRYSIYCFDEYKSIFYIQMFKTNRSNDFVIDNDHLFTKIEKETNKIYSPLKTRDHAYIAINNFDKEHTQYLFLDNDGIIMLKSLFSTISDFSSFCTQLLPDYINHQIFLSLQNNHISLDDIEKAYIKLKENITSYSSTSCKITTEDPISVFLDDLINAIKNIPQIQCEVFLSYLMHICTSFKERFEDYFSNSFECRAVFRANYNNEQFRPICSIPTDIIPKKTATTNKTGKPRVYKYENSLIMSSYRHEQSLVYSINQSENNFVPENWDDFIVIVPEAETVMGRDKKGKFVASYPPLSFTFSVRIKDQNIYNNSKTKKELLKELSYKLLLLQFSEVEKIISTAINAFTDKFPLRMKDFVDYCKNKF